MAAGAVRINTLAGCVDFGIEPWAVLELEEATDHERHPLTTGEFNESSDEFEIVSGAVRQVIKTRAHTPVFRRGQADNSLHHHRQRLDGVSYRSIIHDGAYYELEVEEEPIDRSTLSPRATFETTADWRAESTSIVTVFDDHAETDPAFRETVERNDRLGTGALTRSMLTTVTGLGVLWLTVTSLIRDFGALLAPGVFYAYLCSIVLVPPLVVVWDRFGSVVRLKLETGLRSGEEVQTDGG